MLHYADTIEYGQVADFSRPICGAPMVNPQTYNPMRVTCPACRRMLAPRRRDTTLAAVRFDRFDRTDHS